MPAELLPKFLSLSPKLRNPADAGPRVVEEYVVNYKLSRAVAILSAAHKKMAAADSKLPLARMADLELMGERTGAIRVPRRTSRLANTA